MATTTNYGWTTPDDTALVKDGASAIRTLGSSVDTTTKNLNPSTTLGDLEFRSSTSNVNTRLGIGSSGQHLTVVAGVPAWATASDQTPLTTKGDLFTFSTLDARLGVGANATVLTADSAEATGLKWATPSASSTSYTNLANGTGVGTSTTVTFSGLSGYNKLLIMMRYISGDTASASLQMRLNADTGANYNNFNNQNRANTSYGVGNWTNDVTLNDSLTTLGTTGTNTGSTYVGYIEIDGANSTNHKMLTYGLGLDANTGTGALFSATGATFYKGSSVISSLTLLLSTGSFDGGTVYIYGGN